MSEDASFELQKAIVQRLKADATVSNLVGNRVFDDVPRNQVGNVTADFPYISFGPEQELPDHPDGLRISEFVFQIDAWSRKPGFPEVKRIARAIEDALHEVEFALADNAQVYFVYDTRRIMRDPDGITSHAALTFRVGIDKP